MPQIRRMFQDFLDGKDSPITFENAVVLALVLVLSMTLSASVGRVFGVTIGIARAALGGM